MDWNFSEGTSPSNLTQQTVKSTHCRGLWPFCPGRQNDWETRTSPKNTIFWFPILSHALDMYGIFHLHLPFQFIWYIYNINIPVPMGDMHFWIIWFFQNGSEQRPNAVWSGIFRNARRRRRSLGDVFGDLQGVWEMRSDEEEELLVCEKCVIIIV